MAALFYQYALDSMMKNSVGPGAAPALTDMFDGIVTKNYLTIITQVSITNQDTYQFFMTFDDFVHHYYFGKAVGNISIQGMLFQDCNDRLPGLRELYRRVGDKRGKKVTFSMGGFSFIGVLTDFNVTMVSEPETMATFTANFAMIDHTLPPSQPSQPAC